MATQLKNWHYAAEPHEALLGEWIGVSLDRLFQLQGRGAAAGKQGQGGTTVVATEVRPRAQPRPSFDGPRPRRAEAAVTIVKWQVCAAERVELIGPARRPSVAHAPDTALA